MGTDEMVPDRAAVAPYRRRLGRAACVAGLLAAAVAGGCERTRSAPRAGAGRAEAPVPVMTAGAEKKDVPVEIENIGTVEPFATVTIRPQIAGLLTEVHVKEGAAVKKGDLLFTIDPRPAEAAVRQAEASLARDTAQ
jgi:multidrug efflux system membrane fusion protein